MSHYIYYIYAYIDKMKKVQRKISEVEHLILLNEKISNKYKNMTNIIEKKTVNNQSASSRFDIGNSNITSNTIKSRTSTAFHTMIIDERRKLDMIEKKIKDILKKVGVLDPKEMYNNGKSNGTEDRLLQIERSMSSSSSSTSSKEKGSATPRRASVSFRAAVENAKSIQPFSPKGFSKGSMKISEESEEDSEETLLAMTEAEREKRLLFKKAEHDRLSLISENEKLRHQLESLSIHESTIANCHTDLTSIVNDLNAWELERDDLDGEIDRLLDLRDTLKQNLIEKGRVFSPVNDDENEWLEHI